MTTETQCMANCKSLFQQAESTLRYLDPRVALSVQGLFKAKVTSW